MNNPKLTISQKQSGDLIWLWKSDGHNLKDPTSNNFLFHVIAYNS